MTLENSEQDQVAEQITAMDPLNAMLNSELADDQEVLDLAEGSTFGPDDLLDQEAESTIDPDIDAELSTEELPTEGAVDEGVEAADPEVEVSRSEKRIRGLVDEAKGLSNAIDERDGYIQRLQAQTQNQFGQLQQQAQAAEARNTALEADMVRLREDKEDAGDDVSKFRREVVRQANADADQRIEAALAPVKAAQAQANAVAFKARQAQERAVRLSSFGQQADTAMDVVLKDLAPEDAKKIHQVGGDWLINASAAHGRPPNESQAEFKQFLDDYYQARGKAERASRKESLTKSRQLPTPVRRGQAGARGTAQPKVTRQQVWDAGYENYFDASVDNFAKIRPSSG